jgi:hypothetical protein
VRRCLLLTLLAAAAAGAAAYAAAGCGGPAESATLNAFAGSWQRVSAGEPDPTYTLDIAAAQGGANLTFANHLSGRSLAVSADVSDGVLEATVLAADDAGVGVAPSPTPTILNPDDSTGEIPGQSSPQAGSVGGLSPSAGTSPAAGPPPAGGASAAPGALPQGDVLSGAPTSFSVVLSIDDTTGQITIDVVMADGSLQPTWIYQRAEAQ